MNTISVKQFGTRSVRSDQALRLDPNCLQRLSTAKNFKKQFSYLSKKTYVVGAQKNRLNETVLLST